MDSRAAPPPSFSIRASVASSRFSPIVPRPFLMLPPLALASALERRSARLPSSASNVTAIDARPLPVRLAGALMPSSFSRPGVPLRCFCRSFQCGLRGLVQMSALA